MEVFKVNTGRMLDAFTKGTYEVHEAIYEFADNAEAANANHFVITAEKGNGSPLKRIILADDGDGMTSTGLVRSLEFAGNRERKQNEISEFGVGYKAAGFSLANSITIITKSSDGTISGAHLDRAQINDTETYEGPNDPPTKPYDELWQKYAVDPDQSGTIYVLDGLLQQKYNSCKSFITGIRHVNRLATRYRIPIDSGSFTIYTVNGSGSRIRLPSHDPLHRTTPSTELVLSDKTLIHPRSGARFNVALTRLPAASKTADFGVHLVVAGIEVCVDNRSLMGMYSQNASHSYRWLLRGEIRFDTKEEFHKLCEFASHKHAIKIVDVGFGDWLRDTDFGKEFTAEADRRQKEKECEIYQKQKQTFAKASADFVDFLNNKRYLYGNCHELKKKYCGKIAGIKPGVFSDKEQVSRFDKGNNIIFYNEGNPTLSSLMSTRDPAKEHIARVLAASGALIQASSAPIGVEECFTLMCNLLALKL